MSAEVDRAYLLALLPDLKALMSSTSDILMSHFASSVAFEEKADGSPVTLADQEADANIRSKLQLLTPSIPLLSEEIAEQVSTEERLAWSRLWLIDPLDGTRQFVRGDVGFSINVALIEQGLPVLGVVYSPVERVGYWGGVGFGAWRWQGENQLPIAVSKVVSPVRVITGYSSVARGAKTQAFLAALPTHQIETLGSALKMCRVAEGLADVYPRFGQTCEWDTAAGQAIVEAAGGVVCDLMGQKLAYNQRDTLQNPAFVVVGEAGYSWPLLAAINA